MLQAFKHAVRQVETPRKAIIFVVFMSQLRLHYIMTRKKVDAAIDAFILTTSKVLRPDAPFSWGHSFGILQNTYSTDTNVLLHFERKNDVTIIIKLHRDTRLLIMALPRDYNYGILA